MGGKLVPGTPVTSKLGGDFQAACVSNPLDVAVLSTACHWSERLDTRVIDLQIISSWPLGLSYNDMFRVTDV